MTDDPNSAPSGASVSTSERPASETPASQNPAPENAAPGAKVEKPNLRAPLPEDLEAELQAALGEGSLEDLIASDSEAAADSTAGEPLEVESRHKGTVLRIFRDSVFIDLGGRNQGVLV